MTSPSFTVVIPTYNRGSVLERTLRHLAAQQYPPDRIEVIVADNSSDDTPQRVARVAAQASIRIRHLQAQERLPAVKRNQALQVAGGDYVVFLNDDIWVEPDFLLELARTHESFGDEPVAVLGHVEQSDEMPHTPFIEWYRPFAYEELAGREESAVPWQYFWSICVSVPRKEALGRGLLFHQDWAEIGNEDVELGYRWAKAGRRLVYTRRARGAHFHPHTLDSACQVQRSIGRGLRDLEVLVPEPWLLERYGVLSAHNSARSIIRGTARSALFNRWTTPAVKSWLEGRKRNSRLTRWLYWKVLLHHTNRGYREAPLRRPAQLPIMPPMAAGNS